ncbi:hypothetical protein [Alteribacillus sp. HJP-4]|uniref:hypothetical protein n=1 Tax=Alteribacillus sp. HJP-4 TaxID=2775394 RepID=UPI0035CCEC00
MHKNDIDAITMNTIQTANDWITQANKQNISNVLELTDPNIKIAGPRGEVTGSHVLEEWLKRANLQLTTLTTYAKKDRVMLEQQGRWYGENNELEGEAVVYTVIKAADGKVNYLSRYDRKHEAFADSHLTEEDLHKAAD